MTATVWVTYQGETLSIGGWARRWHNRPQNLELWASVQPRGQRVEDLLAFAHEIVQRYGEAA